MPKQPSSPASLRRKVLIACAVIAVLATAVIVSVLIMAARTQAPASNAPATLTGEFVCLPHKNTDGPQTLECAYGLRTDDGRFYGIQIDPSHYGDIKMGQRVEVTGILTTGSDSNYNIVGTIKIESYRY